MLQMKKLPGTLPAGTAELLEALEGIVPRIAYRPGADPEETLYQQGARDLVDILIERWKNPVPEETECEDGEWYDAFGEELRDYIECDD